MSERVTPVNPGAWHDSIGLRPGGSLLEAAARVDQAARNLESSRQSVEEGQLLTAYYGWRRWGENLGGALVCLDLGVVCFGPGGWPLKLLSVPAASLAGGGCKSTGEQWSDDAVAALATSINEAREQRLSRLPKS